MGTSIYCCQSASIRDYKITKNSIRYKVAGSEGFINPQELVTVKKWGSGAIARRRIKKLR